MTETLEISPCPKCGYTHPSHQVSSDGEIEWIRCPTCRHEGALGYSKAEAVLKWNNRPTQSPTKSPAVSERELLPCPFCGSEQVAIAPDRAFSDTTWSVICKSCAADITRDLEGECIVAWNTRLAPAPEKGVRDALEEARRQLEYLDERFPTGTTPAVIARIDAALAQPETARVGEHPPIPEGARELGEFLDEFDRTISTEAIQEAHRALKLATPAPRNANETGQDEAEGACVIHTPLTIAIDRENLAVAIAECFLCQPKEMAWEDRTDELAGAVIDFLVPRGSATHPAAGSEGALEDPRHG